MIAVDGPVAPSEISQDIQGGIMNEDSIQKSSAWTSGPKYNMWTGGRLQVQKSSPHSDDLWEACRISLRCFESSDLL